MISFDLPRVAVGFGLAAALAAVVAVRPAAAPDDPVQAGPLVEPEVLARALASSPPDRPTLSDEIDHFRARLASRGDEAFSHRRLAGAHLLRYRAYGQPADMEAAERHLAAAAGTEPGPADLALRASLHLARHEFSDALEVARAADRMTGGRDPDIRFRLFDAYLAGGRVEEARAILRASSDSASVDWMSRRARILDMEGDVVRARALFRQVAEGVAAYSEPAAVRAWAHVELGHYVDHAGDPARGVTHFLRALELLPGSPAALEAMAGIAYGVDGNLDAAAALYRRALAYGGHLDILPRLAAVEEERGRVEEAQRLRASFVEMATGSAEAERLHRRSLALLLADDPATACRALELARADLADRRDAGAWSTFGWALFHVGEIQRALAGARLATASGQPEPGMALRAAVIRLSADAEDPAAAALLQVVLEGSSELTTAESELARALAEGGPPPAPSLPGGCG